jgi:hypothetical protein
MTIQVQASRFGDNADKANLITVVHHVQRASSILCLSWSTTWIFHVQQGCPDLSLLQYSFRVILSDHSERENSRAYTNIVCSRSSNCSESTDRRLNARTSSVSSIRVGMSRHPSCLVTLARTILLGGYLSMPFPTCDLRSYHPSLLYKPSCQLDPPHPYPLVLLNPILCPFSTPRWKPINAKPRET